MTKLFTDAQVEFDPELSTATVEFVELDEIDELRRLSAALSNPTTYSITTVN